MMKRIILFIAAFFFTAISLLAESDEHKQILVFRKSGVTNIFYSDKIARIELTKFDTDSVEHEELVSQAFVRSDGTAVIIPIADIDSVAFGSRNAVKVKSSVRRLTEEEAAAIEDFSETKLRYKAGTQSSLIVKAGEKVYYDRMTEVMPYGLCAYVKSVNSNNGIVEAAIDYLSPEELFDEYFLSGDEADKQTRALGDTNDFDYDYKEFDLPLIENDAVTAKGHFKLKYGVKAENTVFTPLKKYYHATITAYFSPEFGIEFEAKENVEKNIIPDPLPVNFRIPLAWGSMSLDVDLGPFLDFKVEAGLQYEYNTEYKVVVEWERKGDQNYFSEPVFTQTPHGDMEQKIQCHLSGELFTGIVGDVGIGVLFDRLGAGAVVKAGPELKGEFSLGVLNQLSTTYSQEAYAKAELTLSAKLAMETYTYHLDKWLFGKQERTRLPFEPELSFEIGKLNLFPNFNTRSTVGKQRKAFVRTPERPKAIDVATYTEKPVEVPVEVGFEIADQKTDETIKSLWDEEIPDVVQSKTEEVQNFDTEFPLIEELKDIDPDKVVVRPIFKYRDKIIKAAPASPLSGMFLSPVIYHGNRNAKFIVSGQSVVHQSTIDETTYHQGNILPVVEKGSKYGKRTANTVEFIEVDIPGSTGVPRNSLLGTWTGNVMNEDVTIEFTDDSTGSYGGVPFTYKVNSPRKGGISIKMENGSTITFLVLDLNSSTMTIAPQSSKKKFILTKG